MHVFLSSIFNICNKSCSQFISESGKNSEAKLCEGRGTGEATVKLVENEARRLSDFAQADIGALSPLRAKAWAAEKARFTFYCSFLRVYVSAEYQ